jgi:ubiquinol-cytochrome c reductase subunit 7
MSALGTSLVQQIRANKPLYRFLKPIATWYADLAGYRKFGLRYDDLIMEENQTMQKVILSFLHLRDSTILIEKKKNKKNCSSTSQFLQAITRLTEREQYDRSYRLRVASQCSVLHKELPKEEWTKPENVAPLIYHLPLYSAKDLLTQNPD